MIIFKNYEDLKNLNNAIKKILQTEKENFEQHPIKNILCNNLLSEKAPLRPLSKSTNKNTIKSQKKCSKFESVESKSFQSPAINFSDLEVDSVQITEFYDSTQSEVDFNDLVLASEESSTSNFFQNMNNFNLSLTNQFAKCSFKGENDDMQNNTCIEKNRGVQIYDYLFPNSSQSNQLENWFLTNENTSRLEKIHKIDNFFNSNYKNAQFQMKKVMHKLYDINQNIRFIGEVSNVNQMHGYGKLFWPNGNLNQVGYFSKDQPSSEYMLKFSYNNQKLQFAGKCEHNFKKLGKLFHENGVLLYSGRFLKDRIDGGNCQLFYKNGNLMYEGAVKTGKPYNNGKFYNENFEIIWKIFSNERLELNCYIYDIDSDFGQDEINIKHHLTNKIEIEKYLSNFSFYNEVIYSL